MAVLNEHLSVWEIGFRWAGRDPDRLWLWLPLAARDNFRNLMVAILQAELLCISISLEKPTNNPDLPPEFSIYRYLDDVEACIAGHRFNRKLLRLAIIDRYGFMTWCERRGIPLPEFWFPPGWKLDYELPEDELLPGHSYLRRHWSAEEKAEYGIAAEAEGTGEGRPAGAVSSGARVELGKPEVQGVEAAQAVAEAVSVRGAVARAPEAATNVPGAASESRAEAEKKLRASQHARAACQQIATEIWRRDPSRTIASVVKDDLVQKYGGGAHYVEGTVRTWVQAVAPAHVSQKRGRPRKENGAHEK